MEEQLEQLTLLGPPKVLEIKARKLKKATAKPPKRPVNKNGILTATGMLCGRCNKEWFDSKEVPECAGISWRCWGADAPGFWGVWLNYRLGEWIESTYKNQCEMRIARVLADCVAEDFRQKEFILFALENMRGYSSSQSEKAESMKWRRSMYRVVLAVEAADAAPKEEVVQQTLNLIRAKEKKRR